MGRISLRGTGDCKLGLKGIGGGVMRLEGIVWPVAVKAGQFASTFAIT